MLPLWYSPIYTDGIDPEARFPRERYRRVRDELEATGAGVDWREIGPIPIEELLRVHDRDYVTGFLEGTLEESVVRRIGLRPWTEQIVERTLVLTHGTIAATREVLERGGCAGNVGGGTHHAYFDFGSGYCVFNDLAVAARIAREEYGVGRILVLDLDVHQGDGTAALFESDPDVVTVSFHCGMNFPFRKMRSDHDVVFPEETGDEAYLDRLDRFLAEETPRIAPDLILFQGGVDPLAEDRLGRLGMSRDGLRERNERVFALALETGVPLVLTMGGGYAEPLDISVVAHADLFRGAASAFGAGRVADRGEVVPGRTDSGGASSGGSDSGGAESG